MLLQHEAVKHNTLKSLNSFRARHLEARALRGVRRVGPGFSGCHGGQLDRGIVAQGSDGFQRHVPPSDGPFVVLLEQHGADESGGQPEDAVAGAEAELGIVLPLHERDDEVEDMGTDIARALLQLGAGGPDAGALVRLGLVLLDGGGAPSIIGIVMPA